LNYTFEKISALERAASLGGSRGSLVHLERKSEFFIIIKFGTTYTTSAPRQTAEYLNIFFDKKLKIKN